MSKSIKNKDLHQFAAATGRTARRSVQNSPRIARILAALDAATLPGTWTCLTPRAAYRSKWYAVDASGNWRITFAWDEGAIDVDFEDDH